MTAFVICAALGEWLCVQRELQEIPIGSGEAVCTVLIMCSCCQDNGKSAAFSREQPVRHALMLQSELGST